MRARQRVFFGKPLRKTKGGGGNAAANLALLRRWVLSPLQRNESISGGIEKKRLQAAWNDGIREELLGLFVEV